MIRFERKCVVREAIVKIFSRCPATCAFCDYGKSKTTYGAEVADPTLDQLDTFFEEFSYEGGQVVILSGGETTLRKDFDQVVALAKERGLFVVFNTAGIGLQNTGFRNKLLDTIQIDMIVFSLDSLDQEKHDKARGIVGLFRGIELFLADRNRNLVTSNKIAMSAIRFVVTKQNFRELRHLVDFADRYKLDAVKITILEGLEASHLLLDEDDLEELENEIKPSLYSSVEASSRMNEDEKQRARLAIAAFLAPINRSVKDISRGLYRPFPSAGCDLPDRFTMIKEDGSYLECCQAEYFGSNSLGNVFEQGLPEIRKSNEFFDVQHDYCQYCGEFDAFQLSFGNKSKIVEQR